jgi:hypothetical protein
MLMLACNPMPKISNRTSALTARYHPMPFGASPDGATVFAFLGAAVGNHGPGPWRVIEIAHPKMYIYQTYTRDNFVWIVMFINEQ